jgi:hypothetical protein
MSASAPAVEASLPTVPPSSLPSVLAKPNENVDMDDIVGASIGDACILHNLTAESQASASVPAVESSLPAALSPLLAQPNEYVDIDGASIGKACIFPSILPNLMAASLASTSAPVHASLPAVLPSLSPSGPAQPNGYVDMDEIVGTNIGDACILRNWMAASQAEAVGVAARSPNQADTSVRLALLQAGDMEDGIQSKVSLVMTSIMWIRLFLFI